MRVRVKVKVPPQGSPVVEGVHVVGMEDLVLHPGHSQPRRLRHVLRREVLLVDEGESLEGLSPDLELRESRRRSGGRSSGKGLVSIRGPTFLSSVRSLT